MLLAHSAGEAVRLSLLRQDKPLELTATLGATSRPMKLGAQRASLDHPGAQATGGDPCRAGEPDRTTADEEDVEHRLSF